MMRKYSRNYSRNRSGRRSRSTTRGRLKPIIIVNKIIKKPSYEERMKAKGLVYYAGEWMTPVDRRIIKMNEAYKAQRAKPKKEKSILKIDDPEIVWMKF